jgi:hypothetical protein
MAAYLVKSEKNDMLLSRIIGNTDFNIKNESESQATTVGTHKTLMHNRNERNTQNYWQGNIAGTHIALFCGVTTHFGI